jgi:hypothetical protein
MANRRKSFLSEFKHPNNPINSCIYTGVDTHIPVYIQELNLPVYIYIVGDI